MREVTWQHVGLVAVVMAGVAVVTALTGDPLVIIGLAAATLAGAGLASIPGLRAEVNGRVSELIGLAREMAARLAETQPPPRDPPA